MLSTQNLTALPDELALQRICKALAVLDAIISPEEEYRYHTYDAHWGEGEEVFELNDGEGDQMLVLFAPEGAVINGYADGLDEVDKAELTPALPRPFHEFMLGEPVSSIGTTFCLWTLGAGPWQPGPGASIEDGSDELLYILDGHPRTYVAWAQEYFEAETFHPAGLPLTTVAQLYYGETLTKPMVLALVKHIADWEQLRRDLDEINYPYDFD
ncbi:hypothetical protein SAMN02745146_2217 [Hymenobacter daecheongensis DSM 21074]|uniref:Uncharacterized protein n=1 Tax=Hymenobacter daecheongensis DSM 21074 TaxID=1121955 RepID=A0A1M6GDL1_9BACT|nr:hypothetical protein [Hymenobacter daecheongensis]SHJ07979.1 hypothetical protein SAMN02745146_2217 [Hymenobacter daecheongensis DSM 21074]